MSTPSSETGAAASALPDAVERSFVTKLPAAWRPYASLMRLDRPIGWWLLLLPCWWSEALAARLADHAPNLLTLALFLIGAVVMRGAGSVWNDITDRDLDAQVVRTRARPIPAGLVSIKQAFALLGLLALIGLGVLLSFNRFAILMGMLSLLLIVIYPFMKRVTLHPQIVLGLAFAWGALMGFAATLGTLPPAAYFLYAGAIAWVIGYDTIYALQDIEDDVLVGIGSTARAYGAHIRLFIGVMYALTLVLVGIAIVKAGGGMLALLGLGGFALHLGWQVWRIEQGNTPRALMLFRSNRDAGLILFAGLALDALLRF